MDNTVSLRPKDIGVLFLHPGGVPTRIGPEKGVSERESVDGMRQMIEDFSMDMSGSFLQYDVRKMAW